MLERVSLPRAPGSSGPAPRRAGEGAVHGPSTPPGPPRGGGRAVTTDSASAPAVRVALANLEALGAGVGDAQAAQTLLARLAAALPRNASAALAAQAQLDGRVVLHLLR